MEIKKTHKGFVNRFNRDIADMAKERHGLSQGMVLDLEQGLVKCMGLQVGVVLVEVLLLDKTLLGVGDQVSKEMQ